ncbi:MAG: DUF2306 domain-containing protein [Croceibacterium sp.]
MTRLASNWPTRILRAVIAVFSIGIAVYSYRYLTGTGSRSPEVLANTFANPFLMLHVAGGATALLIGSLQFFPRLRSRRSGVHRLVGRVYVGCCLLGAAAGLPLALGSTAGPIASGGFASLAVAWFVTTSLGWRHATQRRFAEHRRWMLRSWAVTTAAVSLRLMLPVPPALGFDFFDGYRLISWLCWIFNLAVVEVYLRWSARAPARPAVELAATA